MEKPTQMTMEEIAKLFGTTADVIWEALEKKVTEDGVSLDEWLNRYIDGYSEMNKKEWS